MWENHQGRGMAYRPSVRLSAVAIVVAIGLALASCSSVRSGRPVRALDPESVIEALETDKQFRLEELVLSYYKAKDNKARREIRNLLIDVGIILIDQHFELFVREYSTDRKDFDAGMEIGSMATAAVATIVTPAVTKSILSAISGGLTAAKTVVDKTYFYDQTMQVIIKQMDAQRRSASVALLLGIPKSIENYPLSAALLDLHRYYTAGTIDGALAGIQQNAAIEAEEAKKTLLEYERARANTQIVRTRTYTEAARAWLQSNDVPIARFVAWYGGLEEPELGDAAAVIEGVAYTLFEDVDRFLVVVAGEEDRQFDPQLFLRDGLTPEAAAQIAGAFPASNILGLDLRSANEERR